MDTKRDGDVQVRLLRDLYSQSLSNYDMSLGTPYATKRFRTELLNTIREIGS